MKALDYINTTYSVEIELSKSPENVFSHIINLAKWWPEEFIGDRIKPDGEFNLKVGEEHHSKNKVVEFAPEKKLVWLTTESIRNSDGYDWSGTKFIFELSPKGDKTILKFTYNGVVLENEKGRLAQICDMCIKGMLYNFVESFSATIEVTNSPQDIFKRITIDVAKWWGGKDFSGRCINLNDEFIINHPGAHYSKQKLVEVIPGKKLVWLVTESNLGWLKNQEEWTNTKMIFEISPKNYSYLLQFTHEGLTSEKESYVRCCEGWNMVIKDWLYTLIMYGKPHFEL
ncbi:MAG TPA: SRPBCC domain-containing protein [Bacteroidia bacterium]|nr:SRPBCC domain-containing protein [Bacteroidia bacterium]